MKKRAVLLRGFALMSVFGLGVCAGRETTACRLLEHVTGISGAQGGADLGELMKQVGEEATRQQRPAEPATDDYYAPGPD